MEITLEDALSIFSKWKEESALIAVVAEGPFRQHQRPDQHEALRDIHASGVRWTMRQDVKVSRVSNQGIVHFEGPAGNLSLAISDCHMVYQDPREARPEIREEARSEAAARLCVFFRDEEGFIFYEMPEP